MRRRLSNSLVLVLTAALGSPSAACGGGRRAVSVVSPDGKNTINLEVIKADAGRALAFSVFRSGRPVIEPSRLKIVLAGKGDLALDPRILEVVESRVDETFELPWGKSRSVRNFCSSAHVSLKSRGGVLWDFELRAYDDGVAYRYAFPEQDGLGEFTLEEESSEWRLAANPTLILTNGGSFTTSHEREYERLKIEEVPGNALIELPILAYWPDGASAALTEARLRDFAGMYLKRLPASSPPALQTVLSPLPSRPGVCVISRTPHLSPWRVVLLADRAGLHLESNLLLSLNDPPQWDFSWIQPGKTTWHWWNGVGEKHTPSGSGMSYELHKTYIDFCAQNGIAYHAVVGLDRPWYGQSKVDLLPGPDTDILRPLPELELPRILEYAKKRGVGIRLWVHWEPLSKRLEEAFSLYEQWGVRGLMVDFLDRDDQEMVQFVERVLESAARHKLHIQFHGAYKPTGEQRTFPHLYNREGALNLEYLKWSARCTPQHNINVAYTRNLAGPLDYHLGGFRSASSREFKPRSEHPFVLGTRCHHLALYLVFENPMPQVCDTPSAYEGQAGFDFLKEVATTWDETRFLEGEPGEFLVLARRKDATWYLGGITNQTPRELTISCRFLGSGKYDAKLYVDGSLSEDEPNAVRVERQTVSASTALQVKLAPGGGFVSMIQPVPKK